MNIYSLFKKGNSTGRILLLIFFSSLFLFGAGTGKSSIYILDESKNAQCAWEMLKSDDHIVPTFNGQLRTDKPALHYYIMMVGFLIFGKTAFAARIFSAIAGSFFMVFIFMFVSIYLGRRIAFWTIAVLLGSILFVTEFHLAVPDPYLIVFTGLGLMAFFHFFESKEKWALYVMYFMFSLGILAKGPVAIALPGLSIIVYLIFKKQFSWTVIKLLKPLTGILILLLISSPWYILVHIKTQGEWTRGFFLDHNLNRFTHVKEGHGGSFLVTFAYFAMGLLPFIVFLRGIIRNARRERYNNLILFSLIIVSIFIVFFSVSRTKLPNYCMPAYPFAAIIIGSYLASTIPHDSSEQVNMRVGLWILLIISAIIPLALTFGVVFEPVLAESRYFGYPFIFLPVGIAAAILYEYKLDYRKAFLTVFITFVLAGYVYNNYLMPSVDRWNPVARNKELLNDAASVKFFRNINPSFIFNYGQIGQLKDTAGTNSHLLDPSNILITSEKAILSMPSYWEKFDVVYSGKDLFDANKTVIIRRK
jgi:4-amino-4-deoxy-L-arabinose transferase-like glycosyltransferase